LEKLAGPAVAPAESGLSADDARELAALGYTRSAPQPGAAKVDPKDAILTWALLTNAQAASVAGRHDEALREIRKVLAQHPGDAFAWESEYAVHNRRGALEEARAALEHVIELNPSAEVYVRMAWLQLQLERRAECDRALAAAELLEPEHGHIALIRGEWLFRERRFEEAREQFQRALAIDPGRTTESAGLGIRAVDNALAGQR
jgi:tetratricopeptide (TPR) repeat protein